MAVLPPEPLGRPGADRLLTPEDVAERLNVSLRFVRRLCHERRLAYVKVGRLVRFNETDVRTWLAEHRVEAKANGPVVVPLLRPGGRDRLPGSG
jgi:excisionase family DNA binding protein